MNSYALRGNLVDIPAERIYPVTLRVAGGRIEALEALGVSPDPALPYLMPGFVDAHVHIESSMLVPSEFARLAVVHGTVATVSDPHEIANVLGAPGVMFMIDNGHAVPFKFYFGAPSCVPATPFETAGAALGAADVEALLQRDDIRYLSEMMNFPGVLGADPEVMANIDAALSAGKPVDGHAPGLRGEEARRYAEAGRPGEVTISTDHECFTEAEARDKLAAGMHIIIREGSAARNFDALIPLLHDHPDRIMFCSDDKHPDSLVEGHINVLVRRALAAGIPLFHALRAACLNPVRHYGLDLGQLRPGDPADFILVRDLQALDVLETHIGGRKVAQGGRALFPGVAVEPLNRFAAKPLQPQAFRLPARGGRVRVIEALDGELITGAGEAQPPVEDGCWVPDPANDLLWLAVVNRYGEAPPALAFIRHFGLRAGALASSVAHDSHNLIAVGADADSLCRALNLLIARQGGICAVHGQAEDVLPLPVAGLMSGKDGYEVARAYQRLDQLAKAMGSPLRAPFMTLSFMALLVIPHLKLSDRGLFDGDTFRFTEPALP